MTSIGTLDRSGLVNRSMYSWWLALFAAASLTAQAQQDAVSAQEYPFGEPAARVATLSATDQAETLGTGDYVPLSEAALVELVGPIALYPDALLAIILTASSYPLQIVQAARYLERHEQDGRLRPDDDWDDSVVALLNYPEVLAMMSEDIDWSWRLGEVVLAQQADVIAAIEVFRDMAYESGNLRSDDRQIVTRDDGVVTIEPADEKVIYIPDYQPERVIIREYYPVYNYYPRAYPVYYYPYGHDYLFGSSYFWGVSTAFSIGWLSNHIHVHHHSYRSHPYYGRNYHPHHYRHHSWKLFSHRYRHHSHHRHRDTKHRKHREHSRGEFWHPDNRSGARPVHRVADRQTNRAGKPRDRASEPRQRPREMAEIRPRVPADAFRARSNAQPRGPAQRMASRTRPGREESATRRRVESPPEVRAPRHRVQPVVRASRPGANRGAAARNQPAAKPSRPSADTARQATVTKRAATKPHYGNNRRSVTSGRQRDARRNSRGGGRSERR